MANQQQVQQPQQQVQQPQQQQTQQSNTAVDQLVGLALAKMEQKQKEVPFYASKSAKIAYGVAAAGVVVGGAYMLHNRLSEVEANQQSLAKAIVGSTTEG
tara:strand:- start:33 stop:332 length:300 start_codon:yes stop_codon:yes gene_type:complete